MIEKDFTLRDLALYPFLYMRTTEGTPEEFTSALKPQFRIVSTDGSKVVTISEAKCGYNNSPLDAGLYATTFTGKVVNDRLVYVEYIWQYEDMKAANKVYG